MSRDSSKTSVRLIETSQPRTPGPSLKPNRTHRYSSRSPGEPGDGNSIPDGGPPLGGQSLSPDRTAGSVPGTPSPVPHGAADQANVVYMPDQRLASNGNTRQTLSRDRFAPPVSNVVCIWFDKSATIPLASSSDPHMKPNGRLSSSLTTAVFSNTQHEAVGSIPIPQGGPTGNLHLPCSNPSKNSTNNFLLALGHTKRQMYGRAKLDLYAKASLAQGGKTSATSKGHHGNCARARFSPPRTTTGRNLLQVFASWPSP